jgi:hypothetical protein
LKTFENIYSSYCDCAKFIHAVDLSLPEGSDKENTDDSLPVLSHYLISRGVELLDLEENTIGNAALLSNHTCP